MPGSDRLNEDLVADLISAQNGEESFRALFIRFHPRVYGFFRHKGVPEEDARELTQDVFVSVFKGVTQIRGVAQFEPWLFTIARNAFSNYLDKLHAAKRGTAVTASNEVLERIPADTRSIADVVIEAEQVEILRKALEELPDQMRKCVTVWVLEEVTYEEIASRLSISVNTVKAHLFKARQHLKDALAPLFGGRLR